MKVEIRKGGNLSTDLHGCARILEDKRLIMFGKLGDLYRSPSVVSAILGTPHHRGFIFTNKNKKHAQLKITWGIIEDILIKNKK